MTPQEAWVSIGERIHSENKQVECLALLDFICVAITCVNLGNHSFLAIVPPTAPVVDLNLLEHRRRILERDFLALNMALPQLQQNQIAQQLGTLVADSGVARDEEKRRCQQEEFKLIHHLIGDHSLTFLLHVCDVQTDQQLPPVWHALKNAKKGSPVKCYSIDMAKLKCDKSLKCNSLPPRRFCS